MFYMRMHNWIFKDTNNPIIITYYKHRALVQIHSKKHLECV